MGAVAHLRPISTCLAIYMFVCILQGMNFTWKAVKRTANLKKQGFDFSDAEQVFNGPTFTVEDAREYDGEQRFNSTGFWARPS